MGAELEPVPRMLCGMRSPSNSKLLLIVCVCTLFPLIVLYLHGVESNSECQLYAPYHPDNETTPAVGSPSGAEDTNNTKISRLHYLVPTSLVKPPVCANIASAILNRYAMPTMIGYKGEGEFDAKAAHIAKLRAVKRYLYSEAGEDEDDLVLVVDGFDVLAQIPAEAMIERYFSLMAEADQHLADMHGMTVEEAHSLGLRQSVLWGTDKGCFPGRPNEPQCWILPDSTQPRFTWGPKTGNGELPYSESKFLNSGTVIGPLGDLRRMMDGVLALIDETWDENEQYRNSDQYYVSKLYARQEYHRILYRLNGEFPEDVRDGRDLPPAKKDENDITEYHIKVDFDTDFTMTQCHNEEFLHHIKYNSPDNTATIEDDWNNEGEAFKPWSIQMPSRLYKALNRLHDDIPEKQKPDKSAEGWIHSLAIGTNTGTQKVFGFYHNTCSKKHFVERHQAMWYYPFIQTLMKTAVQANRNRDAISTKLIDGRMWMPYLPIPADSKDEYGGVFTDYEGEEFIPFQELCAENITMIIGEKEKKRSLW